MLQDFAPYRSADGVGIVIGPHDPIRERQYDVWWRTLIAGPTRNTNGTQGNDFPGAYLHDPVVSLEHFLWFAGTLDWRVQRVEIRAIDGSEVLGVWGPGTAGVIAEYEQRPASTIPTRWQALRRLIEWGFRFLPETPAREGIADPAALALAAFEQSIDPERSLMTIEGRTGHLMYVLGTSEAWDDHTVDHLELLAQSDVAWGLALVGDDRTPEQSAWLADLIGTIGAFWSPSHHYFTNIYPQTEDEFSGGNVIVQREAGRESTNVWYHMYNHARLAEVALLTDVPWRDELHEAVDHTLALVEKAHYRFPLFWWLDDAAPVMRADDASSAGAFAWLLIRAFDLWGDPRYLAAAGTALEVLHRANIDDMYSESVVIARAAWSAHELAQRTGDARWSEIAADFTAATLRMMYWSPERAGMFQACAAMNYPAFFENIGVFLALDPLLESSPFDLERLLRLQLAADAEFFDGAEPAPAVPFENVSTVEYPFGGQVGKELYAIGEVLQLPYLTSRAQGAPVRPARRREEENR
jgi:hypothetical protein